MANPIHSCSTPSSEFQASPGAPASADLVAECKRLEKLCAELQAERDKLRDELTKTQTERDRYQRTVSHFMSKNASPPAFTKEEALALVGQAPSLNDFIAELDREMRSGA